MKNIIELRPFEYKDEEFLINLRLLKQLFSDTCGNSYYMSPEHSKRLLEENLLNNNNQIYLIIELVEENKPIGYLSLKNIDHINKKVEWGGIVIDPEYSGKGYATIAADLIIKFVFEQWNMNRVYGYWLERNKPSLRMAEKLGFVKEGLLRDYVFKDNSYQNAYICSLVKRDYHNKLRTNNGNR